MPNEEMLEMYRTEANEYLKDLQLLVELEKDPTNAEIINKIFRASHTLKSMSAAMEFHKIAELTHKMEDVFDCFRSGKIAIKQEMFDTLFEAVDTVEKMIDEVANGQPEASIDDIMQKLNDIVMQKGEEASVKTSPPPQTQETPPSQPSQETAPQKTQKAASPTQQTPAQTPQPARDDLKATPTVTAIKVQVKRLDTLMSLVGELVTNKVQIMEVQRKHRLEYLEEAVVTLDRVTKKLQDEVMEIRMIPLEQIFERYPRLVRDVARKEGKKIDFTMSGGEIEMDRTVIDKIADPLMHLLKNAVDHGIEPPEERVKKGKPETGTVKLMARREKNYVIIVIEDDGAGIDVDEVKRVALEKGKTTPEELAKMDSRDVVWLMFRPGFSTSKQVTDISGRGVGLNAVKTVVESIGGSIDVEFEKGKFTRFILQMPLSVAIIKTLLVEVGNETYGIPLTNISEIVKINPSDIKTIQQQETIIIRNTDIPIVRLRKLFGFPEETRKTDYAVIIKRGRKTGAVIVDRVLGQYDITIKPLHRLLKDAKYFSGGTILASGKVTLVLDVTSLI